jgi:PD-(D/E)XK nuclease superfamily protein
MQATTIRPEHKVVLIKIPRSIPADGDPAALLEATSKWWVIGPARRTPGPASPDYALAVHRGRVVAAYRVLGWEPAPSGERWGFRGGPAPELRELYKGMDVTSYFPPGAANPLRYVNCGTGSGLRAERPATAVTAVAHEHEIASVVARLHAEPLTHLMLGHRELFHSNLLAWFFRAMPEASDRVFARYTAVRNSDRSTLRAVHREEHHMDLRLEWPDRERLVIENKVFSLPDEGQLAEYAGKDYGDGDSPRFALLSLTDPSWPDDRKELGGREWRWLSFTEVARAIRDAIPAEDRSYEAETMRHYAKVVELLDELARKATLAEAGDPVGLPTPIRTALGEERLAGAIGKLRAKSVARRVEIALAEAGITDGTMEAGFSKGKPLISWYRTGWPPPDGRVGWQLQGDQFRLTIVIRHLEGRTSELRRKRHEFAEAHAHLFAFGLLDAALGTEDQLVMPTDAPPEARGFCRFDPDFVYRYKKVPGITVGQLEDAAIAYARTIGT